MKRLLLILFVSLSVYTAHAYTQRDMLQKRASLEDIQKMLVPDRQWVPYPAYHNRNGWDQLLEQETKQRLIQQGDEYLDYEWKSIKATAYLEYERSGNRKIMEDPFNSNNRALNALLLAELAEGKGRYTDQLINGVFFYCEMSSWALSAHLSPYQTSKRTLPDFRDHVIDLTAGGIGATLSWIYYYFHDEFDKEDTVIALRLRKNLQERILDTYMNVDRFWWMAFNYKEGMTVNNWNPWCNSNVLLSFLLLEDDKEKLAKAVYRTMVSVDRFINYNHSDGACEEGPSYWGHAAGKLYDYLQVLYYGTGGAISLFNEPLIKNLGEYISRSYVGHGWVVNFADASAKGDFNYPLIYRYGKAVGSSEMMGFATMLRGDKRGQVSVNTDSFRNLESLLYANELMSSTADYHVPTYSWYPETEFCYMTNKRGFFFAAKGGYNNESHNHNDAGTFSLYLNTVPMIIDAGVGTYTRQTFSDERYTIWTMQSNYHNLPMINGVPQSFGSNFKASNVAFNLAAKSFSADISTAYPPEAQVERWVRGYKLTNDKLLISDSFKLSKADSPNRVNFLTWGDVDISKKGVIQISVMGQSIELSYPSQFEVELETIPLDDPRLSNVWDDEIYRVCLTSTVNNSEGNYQFVVKPL